MNRDNRIDYLAVRISRADDLADRAARFIADYKDELVGARACGLAARAEQLEAAIARHSQDRDVWTATAAELRRERRELESEQARANPRELIS